MTSFNHGWLQYTEQTSFPTGQNITKDPGKLHVLPSALKFIYSNPDEEVEPPHPTSGIFLNVLLR